MLSRKEINAEISFLTGLQLVVASYQEIAASRMQRVRAAVLYKRDFILGLSQIFQEAISSYRRKISALMKKESVRNGKTVLVFISANTRLYGDIVQRTFNLFLEDVKKSQDLTEITIIGRLGKELWQSSRPKMSFTYFDFPDNTVDEKVLHDIVTHLIAYEKVIVFYGQFHNILSQLPTVQSISGKYVPIQDKATIPTSYIFEPSLEILVTFFDREIFASVFGQTMHESQLAKFASRLVALDLAGENITISLKRVRLEKQRLYHQKINQSQLTTLSGMSLWEVSRR